MNDKKRKEVSNFISIFRKTIDGEDAAVYARLWHGRHGIYAMKLGKKIDPSGDALWEDFVNCSIDRENIKKINGHRLNNLHRYATKMMTHFTVGLFIYKVFNLLFSIVFLTVHFLNFLWQLWVILVSSAIDFF